MPSPRRVQHEHRCCGNLTTALHSGQGAQRLQRKSICAGRGAWVPHARRRVSTKPEVKGQNDTRAPTYGIPFDLLQPAQRRRTSGPTPPTQSSLVPSPGRGEIQELGRGWAGLPVQPPWGSAGSQCQEEGGRSGSRIQYQLCDPPPGINIVLCLGGWNRLPL